MKLSRTYSLRTLFLVTLVLASALQFCNWFFSVPPEIQRLLRQIPLIEEGSNRETVRAILDLEGEPVFENLSRIDDSHYLSANLIYEKWNLPSGYSLIVFYGVHEPPPVSFYLSAIVTDRTGSLVPEGNWWDSLHRTLISGKTKGPGLNAINISEETKAGN